MVGEMLDFCKAQEDDSFCGSIALYSLYHLPRVQHLELFVQLKRVLVEGSPCLFNVPEHAGEYLQENWLGSEKMYWSMHSPFLPYPLRPSSLSPAFLPIPLLLFPLPPSIPTLPLSIPSLSSPLPLLSSTL